MATVQVLESFIGVLEKDVLGEDRIERHSEYKDPSVFPGGLGFPAGSLLRKYKKEGRTFKGIKGDLYDSNNPAVKKWPHMFGQPEGLRSVEQATAAPGERR